MGKYILVATSGIRKGKEDEFNEWHDNIHIPDVCSLPGVTSGRRFVAHSATPATSTNMAIYEIETEDPLDVFGELAQRVQSGQFVISPAVDPAGAGMVLWEQV